MTPRKPIRVRKARRSSRCPLCGYWIFAGQLIASVRGGAWGCLDHVTREHADEREPAP